MFSYGIDNYSKLNAIVGITYISTFIRYTNLGSWVDLIHCCIKWIRPSVVPIDTPYMEI